MLDVIGQDPDNNHEKLGLTKGAMNLVAFERVHELFEAMGPTMQMSGGSVANTIAGIAALGGTCGFIGKVADDDFGERFQHDLSSMGVELDVVVAKPDEGATGRCHVFVTDDAQRTMATYLGAANQLQPDEITDRLIQRSAITYVEGYLFDLPPAKEAIRRTIAFAHEHESMVALSLSDSFCVERHRADFLDLVIHDVDVLLANEHELCSLFQVPEVSQAYRHIDGLGVLTVVTKGPRGADIVGMTEVVTIPAADVPHVVDQNGAGDLFAAGFLYGLALGLDPVESAELGSLCAGEIISHFGARPENDLELLAIEAGLL
jgi:sugar/nucleoside kinase (ribokinase family)